MSLTRQRITDIERLAADTLETAYGTSASTLAPPIDLNKIAKSLGLTIKQGSFEDDQIIGAYDKNARVIYISDRDDYPRQSFTTAHEIGHFRLHTDKQREVFFRSNIALLDREEKEIEQEANWFAASLLMPENLVRNSWSVMKDIGVMANIFSVSYSAMSWRLKNLGLI